MGAIKILGFLYVGLIFLVLAANYFLIDATYYKIEKTLNQALDAAIVKASDEDDAQRGFVRLEEDEAERTAKDILIKTLQLNGTLENEHYRNSNFQLQIEYLGDVPRIEAEFKTRIDFFGGKLVGLESYEVVVKKKTPYLSLYK